MTLYPTANSFDFTTTAATNELVFTEIVACLIAEFRQKNMLADSLIATLGRKLIIVTFHRKRDKSH